MAQMAGTATSSATQTLTMRAWRDIDLSRVRLLADAKDGMKRSWIMLMPEGEFEHPQYGKLTFSRAKLAEFKRNFDGRVRHIDIALDQDHDGGKATGWLEQLQLRDDGLWGLVRWTSLGEQLLKDQIYRYFSPEFGTFTDPETGTKFSNVIIGGALTNRPFLKSMPAVKLAEVSRRPWASIDKAKLPDSAFLDPKNRRLPVYEGTGPLDANGRYSKRGALNLNGVKAALAAVHGARSGKAMTGLPAGVAARLAGWLKQYAGGEAGDTGETTASEGAGEMATRATRRKTLAEEDAPAEDSQADEQEFADADGEDAADELDESEEAEDSEELDEDAAEEGDEADAGAAELAEKSSGKKPFPGAAKPFGKGGKKPASDAEDAADGGADEDEELDDSSDDDMAYDDGEGDGEDEEAAPTPKRGRSGKGMPATKTASSKRAGEQTTSARMTEGQLRSEVVRLREENRTLREEQFRIAVNRQLAEFAQHIRLSESADETFALPRSFKLAYREHMLSHGMRLSEDALTSLNELVQLALKVGAVPLTSLSSQVESGRVVDGDERRPRTTANDPDMTPEAERIALSEFKRPLTQLTLDEREGIYLRLEAQRRTRGGRSVA